MARLRLPLPWRGTDKKAIEDRAVRKALDAVLGAVVADEEFAKGFLTGNAATSLARMPGTSWSNQGGMSNRLIARVTQNLASSFGRAPEELEVALAQQGMTWGPPFPPGRPLDPVWGYRRPPRTFDYQIGVNTQLTPRAGRISFKTLKALWEAYDVAQICTRHLINDVRSLDYHFEAALGVREDVSEDITKARQFMDSPDKRQPLRAWLHEYLMDAIRYDAGTLYIRRNNVGEPIALEVVNGTTIIPEIDFFGRIATDENDNSPDLTPAGIFHGEVVPAYVQIIEGMVWDWLAADDIIYQPINPMPDSQYGIAPLEAVLLTANTDIRFQWHFLKYFTEGSLPAGFMEAPPDMSDPGHIAEFQSTWDATMIGDQAKLRQIRWVPAGSNFKPAREDKFDSEFPLYLMRRTCAAHGITPADLGFTDTVNKATSETQVDVQFRVGTLPLVRHVEDVVSLFLTEHLKLRVRLRFDTGREVEDRLGIAQAEQIYINSGVISPDEPRTRLGYPVARLRPTPRFINNTRSGPIPLLALESLAGKTDLETFGPAADAKPIDHPFFETPGVMPVIGSTDYKNAQNSTAAMQANMVARASGKPEPYPDDETTSPRSPSTKKKPVPGPEPKPTQGKPAAAAKPPAPAPAKGKAAKGEAINVDEAMQPATNYKAAGIAVVAQDTGRVLMLQRDNRDESKKAAGKWEFPGGLCDPSETGWEAAKREWEEETGNKLPEKGQITAAWEDQRAPYLLFVYAIKFESDVNLNPDQDDMVVTDPDHPNAKQTEVMAWWEPKLAESAGKALRKELRDFDWSLIADAVEEDLNKDAVAMGNTGGPGVTGGITAATGMHGIDLKDDDDDDDEVEKEAVAVQLRQWRENARNRLRKGLPPRKFVSATLPPELADVIWVDLSTATTRQAIDRAFLSKASARSEPGEPEQGLRDALETVISEDLIRSAVHAAIASPPEATSNRRPGYRAVLRQFFIADITSAIERVVKAVAAIFHAPDAGRERRALQQRAQPIAEGLVSALRYEVADVIANAAKAGQSEADIVAAAQKAISGRAKLDARAEGRRAVIAAAHDAMRANGVQRVAWVGGKCKRCQQNAAVSPIKIDDAWPAGPPPVHPECECGLTPAG